MPGASEFTLIETFLAAFPHSGGGVRIGPGDDCAVIAPPRGRELCVTTDAIVEGVHFTRARFSLEDVGHKALAVNLSDLAAMGARPEWFLCAIAMPKAYGAREVRALARGMAALAKGAQVRLAGGNFTSARELSLTLTVAGSTPRGKALLRSGARPGDLLYISGTLGDARAGLACLEAGLGRGPLVARQRRPVPRLALGRLAARYARAAIDLSDGLTQDAGHLADKSGVALTLELERLPLSPALRRFGAERGLDPARLAAAGGEDYELLLAIPKGRAARFERACAQAGERVTRVGAVEAGGPEVILSATGKPVEQPGGFDHFRAEPSKVGVSSRP